MEVGTVNQFGNRSIYVGRNEGEIYVGMNYVEEPLFAFNDGSYELLDYTPTIQPAIRREEVDEIKRWIEQTASTEKAARLALVYGKAGIGKSVVMHDLLKELREIPEYLVLGLKSDQIEFVDTADLAQKIHLAKPIEVVVREMAQKFERVILLIDQIDALSLSLSSNRTPLRSLLKLIGKIQYVPNVRIIISCRPYDIKYDPQLDRLRIRNKWEIKEFSKEQVLQILEKYQRNERLSENLMRFLGNPLHLYLFLKIKSQEQLTDPLSTDLLYHQLWRKYILDDDVRTVDKDHLISLLDALVSRMYERQELSVHIRELETDYDKELQYLLSHELLLLTKSGQVQFFHQTLFDYVYARRFTEKGYKLLDVLKGQHQGLFSRASVKSILTFLRERNPQEYITTIDQLLYAKDDNGKETYRFHLKSLALSNMAFFEIPLSEEINLVAKKIFADRVYINVLFESVYTSNWFNAIWNVIDSKGGWKTLSTEYKEKVMQMCQRSLWLGAEGVLDRLENVLDYDNEEDVKHISSLLQHYELNCSSDRLISFYNKLVKNRLPLEHIHLLRNIIKGNPAFVCQELMENIKLQLQEKETTYFHRINISHDVENLYEELLKYHREEAIHLLVEILALVFEKTKFEIRGAEIYNSTEFFSFSRVTGGHFTSNFVEDATNILIEDFLKNIDDENTKQYIANFSSSEHEGFVFIALYIYTSHPERFKDDVFNIILNRSVLCNAPSWVEYQAVETLRVTFNLMDDSQKMQVIDRILAIDDIGEHMLFKDVVGIRVKNKHPILDIDLHKGKALNVIDKVALRRLSWKAYQERQRIERKFNPERLENDVPSKMTSYSGWPSLRIEQGQKMSPETWHNSMRTYTTNPTDWDKPTLTGQCHLFRDVVGKDPEKFIRLLDDVIVDDEVMLDYPVAGMQGLLDAGRMDEAMHVLEGILTVIHQDVNSEVRGFNLHTLLFSVNDVVKGDHVPEIVFKLLCNALQNAKEPEDDWHKDDKDVHTVGINQSRGNAGYMLVECAKEEKYAEDVFKTIESIAETASVYTRAAILLNLAALNIWDRNRNVILFKRLMHDYDPRLMALPVHNYNPLVYFINYAVEDLMEFFAHAADCPYCYREQAVILWLAWSHNHRDERIKVLLDKMCDTDAGARLSLLNFFGTLNQKMNEDALCYIVHFMEPQFDSTKMGEACDNLFYHTKKWSDDAQRKVAEAFVASPLSRHKVRIFIEFLAGYAIKDPVQTLKWLESVIDTKALPNDYYVWNHIVDVIIQSYNGIKSFNDVSYQDTLEHAMDMIDTIMQNPDNKYLISNFINKLDNE